LWLREAVKDGGEQRLAVRVRDVELRQAVLADAETLVSAPGPLGDSLRRASKGSSKLDSGLRLNAAR
jgi:glycerol-3-phosphate dehydrogenase